MATKNTPADARGPLPGRRDRAFHKLAEDRAAHPTRAARSGAINRGGASAPSTPPPALLANASTLFARLPTRR
jgi:hypothetical protein